jgi:palmitoyl-protein thioesterase
LSASAFKVTPKENSPLPVAVFPGFGDDCSNPGMSRFTQHFAEALNTTAKCMVIGDGASSSIFMSMHEQGETACQILENDPLFEGEFNVVGNSQGGLLARYVVEKCTNLKGRVRNMATFGGPHMGVGKLPHCFSGIICNAINYVIDLGVYWTFVQNHIGPAGYFRDAGHLPYYRSHSTFLPGVNNENEIDEVAYEKFSSLNAVFLGKFEKDTMIYPPSTAWFEELQPDGSIKAFNETDIFLNDRIGLKKLYEEDKITFHAFPGDHLQFSYEDIDEYVIPVLQS